MAGQNRRRLVLFILLPFLILVLAYPALFDIKEFRQFTHMGSYPCDFIPLDYLDSTDRSAVLFYLSATDIAEVYWQQSVITLRSLRSCDQNCRIILFVESGTGIPFCYQETLQEIGVEMVESEDLRSKIPHMNRFECERRWVMDHAGEVDRVFHCDLFDSFFQVSPFSWIGNSGLVFVKEPVKFSGCPWNSAWLYDCYGKEAEPIRGNWVVNSGSIGGSVDAYRKFLIVLTESPNWTNCQFRSADQPIINWLLWTGRFREHQIPYSFADCQTGVFTCQYCGKLGYGFRDDGLVVGPDLAPLKFLHQYNRRDDMSRHIAHLCHIQLTSQKKHNGLRR
jgi:hypothetical protein